MMHRRLRASAFVVTDRSDIRLRMDGTVVGRRKRVVMSWEVERTVRQAVASARLEGVTLSLDDTVRLYREAGDLPISIRRSKSMSNHE